MQRLLTWVIGGLVALTCWVSSAGAYEVHQIYGGPGHWSQYQGVHQRHWKPWHMRHHARWHYWGAPHRHYWRRGPEPRQDRFWHDRRSGDHDRRPGWHPGDNGNRRRW